MRKKMRVKQVLKWLWLCHCVGDWNETPTNWAYNLALRGALDAAGFKIERTEVLPVPACARDSAVCVSCPRVSRQFSRLFGSVLATSWQMTGTNFYFSRLLEAVRK